MKAIYDLSSMFFEGLEVDESHKTLKTSGDMICFKNALNSFLKSGRKEDAFTVYFCFSEIFNLFGKGYDNTQKLLELLSDHEYHSGELLSKHRDHYSHSVYVFALGLAIYANDSAYRYNYLNFYGLDDNAQSSFHFLKFWGMTALFHDIGYPFQLAHEQIKSYVEEVWIGDEKDEELKKEKLSHVPYVSYGNFQKFLAFDKSIQDRIHEAFPVADCISDIDELLAYGLKLREGYNEKLVCEKLLNRVIEQPNFMDHGYFSALILARQLFAVPELSIDKYYLDVLTAILLHNSFNKYDAPDRHPIRVSEHPLAYLLILCDELQCWDRHAYGKISKRDPIAWDINLEIFENRIIIKYFYDSYSVRTEDANGKPDIILNKNYKEMSTGTFVEKILGSRAFKVNVYVEKVQEANAKEPDEKKRIKLYDGYIKSALTLEVQTEEVRKPKRSKLYVSDDSFINLCDLAKAIHMSYDDHCRGYSNSHINQAFGDLPLEFKVSNIEQAKSYAEKLELINCFYSSKDLDYPVVEDFRRTTFSDFKDNLGFLSREEHVRWVKEKLAMGWKYGTDYDPKDVEERNRKKIHSALVPYEKLSEFDRSKDELMINNIIKLLKKFDSNIKIYNYRSGRKPDLEIAGTGHRFIKGDSFVINQYKQEIKEILREYSKNYRVVVRSCFAYGADQLIVECAAELGLTIKADIPMNYDDYIADVKRDTIANGHSFTEEDELRMRHLLAQTVVCKPIPDPKHTYAAASQYIIDRCSKLIVLWDGKETPLYDSNHNPINRGGTYDTIRMAKEAKYGETDFHIIYCQR